LQQYSKKILKKIKICTFTSFSNSFKVLDYDVDSIKLTSLEEDEKYPIVLLNKNSFFLSLKTKKPPIFNL